MNNDQEIPFAYIKTPLGEMVKVDIFQGAEAFQILWEVTNATKHNDPASVAHAMAKAFDFFAHLKSDNNATDTKPKDNHN